MAAQKIIIYRITGHNLFIFFVIATLFCLILSSRANAQTSNPAVFEGEPVYENGIGSYNFLLSNTFSDFSVYSIDADAIQSYISNNNGKAAFRLRLGDAHLWDVNIELFDLRSEDYVLRVRTENGVVNYPRSPATTYRGFLEGIQDGRVRFSIQAGHISGMIVQDGEELFIEAASRFDHTAPENHLVVYRAEDVIAASNVTCGAIALADVVGDVSKKQKDGGNPVIMAACKQAEIAIAADYSMVTAEGSVTAVETFINNILNLVEGRYNPLPLEIQHKLVQTYVVSCSGCDPWYSGQDNSQLLSSFTSWGQSGGFSTTYDVASFWTNRDIGCPSNCNVVGTAYLTSICGSQRYNIIERFTTSQGSLSLDQTHELGHNWSASHVTGSQYIMNATLGGQQWNTTTISAILNHKNSRSCLGSVCMLPPFANFTADNTMSCDGGTVQFTDLTSNNPTTWFWTFDDGFTDTVQNPVHTYANNGNYTVVLQVSNANGNDMKLKGNYITVNTMPAPATTGDSRPGPGVVNLTASGSGSYPLNWYDAPTGGNLVNTGTSYSPNLNVTTTFYVAEENIPSPEFLGPFDNSFGGNVGGYFTANDDRGLVFDVFKPFVLKSVKVFAGSAGNRTIEVLDNVGGTVLYTKMGNIPAGESRVTLDFSMNKGNGYFIKVTGSVDLYRNSSGPSYPYQIAGVASIRESNAGSTPLDYYYYFYDWEIQQLPCSSARASVLGDLGTGGTGIEGQEAESAFRIYPNPAKNRLFIELNLAESEEDINLEVFNVLGEVIYEVKSVRNTGTYELGFEGQPEGIYYVRLSAPDFTRAHKIIITD